MMNLIETILYLAHECGQDLALNPDDGKFYIYRDSDRGLARLSPINEPGQTVVDFEPGKIITLRNVTELQRHFNGLETVLQRDLNGNKTGTERERNGIITGTERDRIGFATELNRELIGEGKVNLRTFSDTCPAEVADVARNIEKLLQRAISNTNKAATIENLTRLHKKAAATAAANNIFQLKQIEKQIAGIVAKQQAIKSSEQTLKRRQQRRQLLTKITIAASLVVSLILYFYISSPSPPPSSPSLQQQPARQTQQTILDLAIIEYETDTGKKIYPSGRKCIEIAAKKAGIEKDKDAIKQLIKQNM